MNEFRRGASDTDPEPRPTLDVLLASLYYLMSRYASNPAQDIARSVAEHFSMLERHPECRSNTLQKTARRMSLHWAHLICKTCAESSGGDRAAPEKNAGNYPLH